MENKNEYLANAEIAFANKQYNESLSWFKKVLEEEPDNIYALSRAGAICVPLGLFEEALFYFGHAKELDPNNGDNVFNYANACFFNKDNVKAFSAYVEAEKLGCSDDVTPRLYYQMALLCSMRQDVKSALIYFDKCEKVDREGRIVLTSDFISERLKMYMVLEDYTNAEKCARQLIAVKPSDLKNYMICFSILMAKRDFLTAESILNDANEYADLSDDDKQTVLLQFSSLYVAMGESQMTHKEKYYDRAIELLELQRSNSEMTFEQKINLLITLSEVYVKAERFQDALACLEATINGTGKTNATVSAEVSDDEGIDPDEIERMIEQDMLMIQERIEYGEIDPEMGMYAEMGYDESGALVRFYDDSVFAFLNTSIQNKNQEVIEPTEKTDGEFDLPLEVREKIYFMYLTCYTAMDEFKKAETYATILKHSSNKYYSYFGLYSATMLCRKINGDTEFTKQKYSETIAFFRNKSFADHSDTLAVIFRARLYAEEGKYEKAKELGHLLSDVDRNSILVYIEECKK